MMKKRFFTAFFAVVVCVFSFLPKAMPIEEYKDEAAEAVAYNTTKVTKSVEGLIFSVEEDRPIEKIAGVYRPIDLDSYIALKFKKLEEKLDQATLSLNKRIDALEQKLDKLGKNGAILASVPAQTQVKNKNNS